MGAASSLQGGGKHPIRLGGGDEPSSGQGGGDERSDSCAGNRKKRGAASKRPGVKWIFHYDMQP